MIVIGHGISLGIAGGRYFIGKTEERGQGPASPGEDGIRAGKPSQLGAVASVVCGCVCRFVVGYSRMITVFTPMIMSNHDSAASLG